MNLQPAQRQYCLLTHSLVSGDTNPVGVTSWASGLRRRWDAGSAPGFGDRPRSGERTRLIGRGG